MDFKKTNAPTTTVTRNLMDLCRDTNNIYESVAIIAKRSNQIAAEMKDELSKKLVEFGSHTDTLDEVFENEEQIQISRYYERLPKPTLIATQEFLEDNVYYRKEDSIRNALRDIDITRVTPLEAMNLLYGFIDTVRKEDKDEQDGSIEQQHQDPDICVGKDFLH